MYCAKYLLLCASLVASAVAQGQRIAFTVLPSTMTAGQDITLHWGGGDDSAVTLTLQQGTTNNLKTVQLVNGEATGSSYTWNVPKTLPDADNYAFKIAQGDQPPNYTGMITLTGGSSSSSSSASATASSAGSANGGGVIGGSSGSSSSNSTVTATAAANATTTAMVGTAASASGTGVSMSRNITMSMATLSSTSASASNTDVGGSGGTPTSSPSAPKSSHTGGAAMLASNFALLVYAAVGVVYLG